jgi:hypothetical protein
MYQAPVMTRYHFSKPLGANFSRSVVHRAFMCHGVQGEGVHTSTAVLSVFTIESDASPVGYICPVCGALWSNRPGHEMQLMRRVVDPVILPEPPEKQPINIGVAGRRYMERKRTGVWPGGPQK